MYIKDRHFSLSGKKWNMGEAKSIIQDIATDGIASLKSGYFWPTHPLDNNYSSHGFYVGTAGMSWALEHLKHETSEDIDFNIELAISKQLENCQREYAEMQHSDNTSYLFGDVPILMMQYRLSQNKTILDELYKKIVINNTQETRELMWGSAGTMVALTHLHRWLPNDTRWKNTFRVQANRLLNELQEDKEYGFLWEPDIYGKKTRYLGPVHGNSGNSLSLIKGKHFIDESEYDLFCEKVTISTVKTGLSDTKYANWPAIAGNEDMPLQHCHGAPGMISALSELPVGMNSDFDQIILKGGN